METQIYRDLIDDETWRFINKTNEFYPADTVDQSIVDQRQTYNRMCRAFFAGRPEGVEAWDLVISAAGGNLKLRQYQISNHKKNTLVLYFHGGGYVVGGLESHDDICAEICAASSVDLVSVDYRLAPEHLHPAAFDDAVTAFNWATKRGWERIVVCGDSAGGNLAAALSHKARTQKYQPCGQVLIYPALGGDADKGSYLRHENAPLLSRDEILYYDNVRFKDGMGNGDPTAKPLDDDDFNNLPPTVVFSAECDPLADDGRNYAEQILATGGKAQWFHEKGLIHGYLRARHSVKRAEDSFDRIVKAVDVLAKGDWPY